MLRVTINNHGTVTSKNRYVMPLSNLVDLPWTVFKFDLKITVQGKGRIQIANYHEEIDELPVIDEVKVIRGLPSTARLAFCGDDVLYYVELLDMRVAEEWEDQVFVKNGKLHCKMDKPKALKF